MTNDSIPPNANPDQHIPRSFRLPTGKTGDFTRLQNVMIRSQRYRWTRSELLVYDVIAMNHHESREEPDPLGIADICRYTALSRSAVIRAINALEARHVIYGQRHFNAERNRHDPNVYKTCDDWREDSSSHATTITGATSGSVTGATSFVSPALPGSVTGATMVVSPALPFQQDNTRHLEDRKTTAATDRQTGVAAAVFSPEIETKLTDWKMDPNGRKDVRNAWPDDSAVLAWIAFIGNQPNIENPAGYLRQRARERAEPPMSLPLVEEPEPEDSLEPHEQLWRQITRSFPDQLPLFGRFLPLGIVDNQLVVEAFYNEIRMIKGLVPAIHRELQQMATDVQEVVWLTREDDREHGGNDPVGDYYRLAVQEGWTDAPPPEG